MGAFLKRFWVAAGSLAALAGGYLAAVPVHLVTVFWVVVAGGAAIAAVSVFVPRSIEYATRIRNYGLLLRRVAALESENQQLGSQLDSLKNTVNSRWEDGTREGRRQFLGAWLASAGGDLTIVGLAAREDGVLVVAKSNEEAPQNGARYYIESGLLGDVMGVVEVRAYDQTRDIIILACVEPRMPEFWKRLSESATFDPSAPPGVILTPYRVDSDSITQTSPSVSVIPENTNG